MVYTQLALSVIALIFESLREGLSMVFATRREPCFACWKKGTLLFPGHSRHGQSLSAVACQAEVSPSFSHPVMVRP
eukprot:symbB.v1.2.035577.t1/scaffold4828.1/size34219/1